MITAHRIDRDLDRGLGLGGGIALGLDLGPGLSRRDQQLVALALQKLDGAVAGFGDALRALREATEELIPDGRVYFLGAAPSAACGPRSAAMLGPLFGPVFGSLISGVGLVEAAGGIALVRTARAGGMDVLGRFGP